MRPIKDPVPIICDKCGEVFMGKYAFICSECRKKAARESAIRKNLNKLGNKAYSKQQSTKKAGEG